MITRWLAMAFLVAASGVARAQTAEEILKKADDTYSNYTDLIIEAKMLIYEPGATTPREFAYTTTMKGVSKRLVRFTAPGDVKGMGMLLEDRDTMYVYLPGFQRVRRMGTHAKNQSFMGSDFGYEDMAETTYSGTWTPKLVGTEGNNWVLDLTINKGKESEFPRQKLWIDKTRFAATKIEFYDATGKLARTETRTDFRFDNGSKGHYSPYEVTIIDHRRNDHRTTMKFISVKADTHVPDDTFSQRALVRGQ
jgi:outer membrane lipoprotein-sorting protein